MGFDQVQSKIGRWKQNEAGLEHRRLAFLLGHHFNGGDRF